MYNHTKKKYNLTIGFRWFAKCRGIWRPLPDYTPADRTLYGPYAPPPIVRGQFYGYDGPGNRRTFDIPRDHGVSFYRGTQTTLVDWPEGRALEIEKKYRRFRKIQSSSDRRSAGTRSQYCSGDGQHWISESAKGTGRIHQVSSSPRDIIFSFFRDNPDPLNPGTGRRYYLL